MKIAFASRRYEHPDGPLRAELARVDFLKIIAKVASEVLVDLDAEPFARFQETGIGGLDLNRWHPLAGAGRISKPSDPDSWELGRPYRDIAPIWRNLEAGAFVCEYFVIDPDDPRVDPQQRFIHGECAEAFARELDRMLAGEGAARVCSLPTLGYKYYPHCPRMVALWESLITWADNHNLIERRGVRRWCLEAAFYTLDWWGQHSEARSKLFLSGPGVREYPPPIEPLEPPVGYDTWLADFEDREVYIKRQLNAALPEMRAKGYIRTRSLERLWRKWMEGELYEYCNRAEQHFASRGWERPKERASYQKHLEWAVRFQVQEELFARIAASPHHSSPTAEEVTPYAVRKGVQEVLDLIGLERRHVNLGPPKKS